MPDRGSETAPGSSRTPPPSTRTMTARDGLGAEHHRHDGLHPAGIHTVENSSSEPTVTLSASTRADTRSTSIPSCGVGREIAAVDDDPAHHVADDGRHQQHVGVFGSDGRIEDSDTVGIAVRFGGERTTESDRCGAGSVDQARKHLYPDLGIGRPQYRGSGGGGHERPRSHGPPQCFERHREREQPRPVAAAVLGHRETQQVLTGERRPERREPVLGPCLHRCPHVLRGDRALREGPDRIGQRHMLVAQPDPELVSVRAMRSAQPLGEVVDPSTARRSRWVTAVPVDQLRDGAPWTAYTFR